MFSLSRGVPFLFNARRSLLRSFSSGGVTQASVTAFNEEMAHVFGNGEAGATSADDAMGFGMLGAHKELLRQQQQLLAASACCALTQ